MKTLALKYIIIPSARKMTLKKQYVKNIQHFTQMIYSTFLLFQILENATFK